MDSSSEDEIIDAVGDGEDIQTNALASELNRLSEENESLKAQIIVLYADLSNAEERIYDSAGLFAEQAQKLGNKFNFNSPRKAEDGDVRKRKYDVDNPPPVHLKELKGLLDEERQKRREVEEKHDRLKKSNNALAKEYNVFVNKIKEYLGEVEEEDGKQQRNPSSKDLMEQLSRKIQERIGEKTEQIIELTAQLEESNKQLEQMRGVAEERQQNARVELPVEVGNPDGSGTSPEKRVQEKKNLDIFTRTKMFLETLQIEGIVPPPPIISAPEEDEVSPPPVSPQPSPPPIDFEENEPTGMPVSPEPISNDFEGNKIAEMPPAPLPIIPMPKLELPSTSSAAQSQSVGNSPAKKKGSSMKSKGKNESHGFAKVDKSLSLFDCTCNKTYTSLKRLQSHIYYQEKEPKFRCEHCNNRFKYKSYLNVHLESCRQAAMSTASKAAKKIQQRRRNSVKLAKQNVNPRRKGLAQKIKSKKRKVGRPKKDKEEPKIVIKTNNYKHLPHHQASFGASDKYTCSCGRNFARKKGLLMHIKKMARKISR